VSGDPAQAVVVSGHETWVLQKQRLTVLDGLSTLRTPPVTVDLDTSDPDSQPMLLLTDTSSGRLWIVNTGGTGEVVALDAFTLDREWGASTVGIGGAAVLDGRLYVISSGALIEFTNTRPRERAELPAGEFYGIATDPTHDRLLLVNAGFPTQLWSYRPGGKLTPVATLPFTKASLAVVAGRVWIGGYGNGGAVLERLDHTRAHPSPLADELGPGARIVAAGQHVVWVRDGDADSGGLWCVDAATGRAAQQWDVDGQAASVDGTAVVANSSGLLRLDLAGCRG
jgi:hypothetical protein